MSNSRPSRFAPDEMTPVDRLEEIAAILARGVLRLRKRRDLQDSGKSPESGDKRLDIPAHLRLHDHAG